MAEVDPGTGLPKEMVEKVQNIERVDRLNLQKGRADQLNTDIESKGGEAILNKIQAHLLARTELLMRADGECVGLMKVMSDVGSTLNMGEIAVRNIMKLATKR